MTRGKPTVLGFCSGVVAGLVVITPSCRLRVATAAVHHRGACRRWSPTSPCTKLKQWLKYDDALDTFGVHGVGGTLGALLTGYSRQPGSQRQSQHQSWPDRGQDAVDRAAQGYRADHGAGDCRHLRCWPSLSKPCWVCVPNPEVKSRASTFSTTGKPATTWTRRRLTRAPASWASRSNPCPSTRPRRRVGYCGPRDARAAGRRPGPVPLLPARLDELWPRSRRRTCAGWRATGGFCSAPMAIAPRSMTCSRPTWRRRWSRRRTAGEGAFLDLGCGIGSVLLLLAWRFPWARLHGIEAQEISAGLARRSIAWNGVADRATVVTDDLRTAAVLGTGPRYQLVTGTPPYFPHSAGPQSTHIQRGPCRFEHRGGIEEYCQAAAPVLAEGAPFVACEAWSQRERVEPAGRAAGLCLVRWREIVPRHGQAAPALRLRPARERSCRAFAREAAPGGARPRATGPKSSWRSVCHGHAALRETRYTENRRQFNLTPPPELSILHPEMGALSGKAVRFPCDQYAKGS